MLSELPTRAAALIVLPVLAAGAGVAAASSADEPAGVPDPAAAITAPATLLPGGPGAFGPLGDQLAREERRRALRRERRARARARALRFPVAGKAGFGEAAARFGDDRGSHVHQGQDVFAAAGTPLLAVADGVVTEAGNGGGRGNYVAIYDRRRKRTYVYFHMQAPATVEVGRRVRAGKRVGRVGCTGSCWGDHLHFEVRLGRSTAGRAVDPMQLLRRARH